jgi:glycosyltransferase involved in cell wall biosynthesis
MKILIYAADYYPRMTGYSNAVLNFVRSLLLDDKFSEIHVITQVPSDGCVKYFDDERVKEFRVEKKFTSAIDSLKLAKYINKKFDEHDYDLLMVETVENPFLFLYLTNKILTKTVVRIHCCFETERRVFYPGLRNYIFKLITKYVAKYKIKHVASTCDFYLEFYKKHYLSENMYHITGKTFFVLPNTYDDTKLVVSNDIEQRDNDKRVVSNDIEHSDDKLQLLMLGRLDVSGIRQKGFMDFIAALSLLSDQYIKKLSVTVVGDGEYAESFYSKLAGIENLDVTVHKKLAHTEVVNTLKDVDAIVLPSRYEGMSMFALEGLVNRNIMIVSDAGGLKAMSCIDKHFTYMPQDVVSMRNSIINAIKLTKSERELVKDESLDRYTNNFSNEIIKNKTLDLIRLVSVFR